MKNAIVLCSGGLDSVTTAYLSRKQGYDKIILLFFDYGQKTASMERKFSKLCARDLGAEFQEIKLGWLGRISTSLINKKGKSRKLERKDLKDTSEESDKYYVPCRNTIFIIHALALAESLFIKYKEKYDLLLGFKCEGKESYPDTTKEFVEEMNKLSEISCGGFKIMAPLIEMDKEDIIQLGMSLGIDYGKTFSCYVGKKRHCGKCLACMLRKEGFYWANVKDPTSYN